MISDNLSGIAYADGLTAEHAAMLSQCVETWQANKARNEELRLTYLGKVPIARLPDSVPAKYRTMAVGCAWPNIAVQSVCERSRFDAFVFPDQECNAAYDMRRIMANVDIATGYEDALVSSQVYGCSFAVVGMDENGPCVRWHSALDAAGLWDSARGRLKCGFAIVDRRIVRTADTFEKASVPCAVDFYVSDGCYELTMDEGGTSWHAEFKADPMGQPRMVAFAYRPDGESPLGHSRISVPMRGIVQEYMANSLNIHVNSEFNAIGQKWATGLSDEQAAALIENKWKHSADTIAVATDNPNTGSSPTFGNFAQQSPEGLLSVKRSLATDFAAMASIPVSELLSQDSNPTSAEALVASKDKLISLVESVNARNVIVLRKIALMLQAVDKGCALTELDEEQTSVMVHMRAVATPTAASMADSAMKLATASPGFAETPVFWEYCGFDSATRARIENAINRSRSSAAISAMMAGGTQGQQLAARYDRNGGEM